MNFEDSEEEGEIEEEWECSACNSELEACDDDCENHINDEDQFWNCLGAAC